LNLIEKQSYEAYCRAYKELKLPEEPLKTQPGDELRVFLDGVEDEKKVV
jgi:hypothetical protein